jgi:hypothetical protein
VFAVGDSGPKRLRKPPRLECRAQILVLVGVVDTALSSHMLGITPASRVKDRLIAKNTFLHFSEPQSLCWRHQLDIPPLFSRLVQIWLSSGLACYQAGIAAHPSHSLFRHGDTFNCEPAVSSAIIAVGSRRHRLFMCRTSHSDNLGRRPVRWALLSLPATFHSFHILPALDLEIRVSASISRYDLPEARNLMTIARSSGVACVITPFSSVGMSLLQSYKTTKSRDIIAAKPRSRMVSHYF